MPTKALVAFGVVCCFGLLAFPAIDHASAELKAEQADTTPKAPYTYDDAHPLTLREAISRTFENSPYLASFSQEVTARNFETRQAGLRPNPELSVEVENVGGSGNYSGTEAAETTLRLSQIFELGDKRQHRQAVGSAHRQLAEGEFNVAKTEAVAETTRRFVHLLAAQMRFSLAEEEKALAQKVLQTVEERFKAGKSTAMESVQGHALVAEARLHQQQAHHELITARQTLAASWGGDGPDFGMADGHLDTIQALPAWTELVAMLEKSPEVILTKNAGKGLDHLLALEQANRLPDLTVSLGTKNDQDSGDNALVAELSIPLPLFNKNQNAIEAARARRAKARNQEQAAQLRVRVLLSEAYQKLQGAHSEVVMLREEIVPAAQKIFDAATYGYQAGKFGFLMVLEAEKNLFEAKERYINALETSQTAMADLERILGQTILSDNTQSASIENKRGQS